MDIFWQGITGHKKLIDQLKRLVKNGQIPHALLFYGPVGIGKRRIAEAFAAALLCQEKDAPCGNCGSCRLLSDADSRHPDFFLIEPIVRGKSTRSIRIEEIRRLETDLSRLPVVSKRRVVIIDDAWLMNEAASNSLLKTLEEPVGDVVFILLAENRESLLPTIVSRCTPVAFGPLTREEIAELLQQRGCTSDRAAELSALADGSIGKALCLHESVTDWPQAVVELLEEFDSWAMEKLLAKAGNLAELERTELSEWLHYLRLVLRDLLVLCAGGGTEIYCQAQTERLAGLLSVYSRTRIFAMLQILADFEQRLNSNANQKLQLEALLLRLHDTIEED